MQVTREDVLRFRHRAQGLDRSGSTDDAAILDLGVQDTGHGGARWSLAVRGAQVPAGELVYAWTLRGAPHAYRRREVTEVAAATAPFDEADAAKRVFDASRPLKAAGIRVLEALSHIAGHMREIVREPTVKGELSGQLSDRLDEPYLRFCRPCDAIHAYEQTFRLSALQAGLELEPGTSPPVLHRIPDWTGPAENVPEHLDPIRGTLRLLGPATPKLVAGFLDAPVRTISAHWPADVVEVDVDGEKRHVLADDVEALGSPPPARGVRLLGPFDLFLQSRDRELVVPDEASRKDLWRTLGRPGAVLVGAGIWGSWRPRSSGAKFRLSVKDWTGSGRPSELDAEAERLAAFRGQTFDGYVDD